MNTISEPDAMHVYGRMFNDVPSMIRALSFDKQWGELLASKLEAKAIIVTPIGVVEIAPPWEDIPPPWDADDETVG